jgi:hypothetical protein
MSLYDVVAVDMKTNKVRLLAENKTERNADAVVNMAVARMGCDEELFAPVAAGKYRDGDEWRAMEEG